MLEMQTVLLDSNEGPGAAVLNFGPPRFLESADGVKLWWGPSSVLAHVRGYTEAWQFTLDGEETYRLIRAINVDWTWTAAMQLLQGASIQQLVGTRYIPVVVRAAPIYSPVPHLYELVVAEPLFTFPAEQLSAYTMKLHACVLSLLRSA